MSFLEYLSSFKTTLVSHDDVFQEITPLYGHDDVFRVKLEPVFKNCEIRSLFMVDKAKQ